MQHNSQSNPFDNLPIQNQRCFVVPKIHLKLLAARDGVGYGLAIATTVFELTRKLAINELSAAAAIGPA